MGHNEDTADLEPLWGYIADLRGFLRHAHRDLDTTLYDVCFFADSEAMVAESSALVLAETEVATASLEWEYADSTVPQTGDLSVVTDWCGKPLCVLETTAAQVLPYLQVRADFAAAEV